MTRQHRILVVDDDDETLRLIEFILQRKGFDVRCEPDGAKAIIRAHSETPDLIILDVMMPNPDGFEVARALRSSPATASVPILFFTAMGAFTDKLAGFHAGGNDYLTKPIHPAELVARVNNLVNVDLNQATPSTTLPEQ